MTREEAIKELENMKKFNYTLAPLEVFDMAIKALWAVEHMPTTKNDLGVDCISREQAINAVNMCSNSETILNLQKLPSVTPQEPFMATPCISSKVCEHDRIVTLNKIRTEIELIEISGQIDEHSAFIRSGEHIKTMVLDIIDKYKAESEG